MSRAEPVLLLAIGMRGLCCGELAEGVPVERHRAPIGGPHMDALLAALDQLGGSVGGAGERLHVLVADGWLPMATVPWDPALSDARTVESWGRMQLGGLGFELQPDDHLRCDEPPFQEPGAVVAWPAALLAALHRFAEARSARLVSVLPWSAAVWSALRPRPGSVLAVTGAGCATFLRAEGERPVLLEQTHFNTGRELAAQWQRLRLRVPALGGVARPDVVGLEPFDGDPFGQEAAVALPLSGNAPLLLLLADAMRAGGHPWDALDYRPPVNRARRAALAAVVLLAAGMAAAGWQRQAEVRQLEQAVAGGAPQARPVAAGGGDERRIRAVNGAIRELNVPVAPLLQALQPAAGMEVALLGIEIAPVKEAGDAGALSRVKLTAEAGSGAEMARYVASLAGRSPLVGAYLVRHQIVESNRYRFTVEATWRD